jgi:DNA-binding HxlR family transcriptional regulator
VLRYGELRRNVIDITPKMLTQSLRELEQDELVHRAVFPESPPRVEYTLTNTGLRFIPFINELREWGDQQMAKSNIPAIAALECEENSDSSIASYPTEQAKGSIIAQAARQKSSIKNFK